MTTIFVLIAISVVAPLVYVHKVYTNPKEEPKKPISISLFLYGINNNETFSEEANDIKILVDNLKREEARQHAIESIQRVLSERNSNMLPYASIIYDRATACGGDYRVILAIAGNESNFGQINYKLYNPYGYLDGVQYASYEEALSILTCKISQRFLLPCNNDLTCIINKYGGSETNHAKWISKAQYFVSLF